ncbi:MAG TPA: Lrp/AsnC ligand binding domain-containing protein [Metabacillus sp.]|nr:Lrp/AsnC ligand binding domain-containing protein [Metabacillus sp.]
MSDVNITFFKFEEIVKQHPDIIECHCLTGQVNYLLKAAVKDMAHLSRLIKEFTTYGYGKINSSIVVKKVVREKIIYPI